MAHVECQSCQKDYVSRQEWTNHLQRRLCKNYQQEFSYWAKIVVAVHVLGKVSKVGPGSAFSTQHTFPARRPVHLRVCDIVAPRIGSAYIALLTNRPCHASHCQCLHLFRTSHVMGLQLLNQIVN